MSSRAGLSFNKKSPSLGLSALTLALLMVTATRATVPVNPLPTPLFSYDRDSIQVTGAPNFKPADILEEGPLVGPALVFVPAAGLGLNAPGDALNGLSFANNTWDPSALFTILFSLDRDSSGAADPDPQLFGNCLPFNAKDQCTRGTQAGDMYMSTLNFSLTGMFARPLNQVALSANNLLVVNNYDEGGTDHKAMPPGSASSTAFANRAAVVGIMDDNVSSSAYQNGPLPPSMPVTRIYFTVAPGSPSLATLPLPQSSANIYFRQTPGVGMTTMFATSNDLGLHQNDVVDAIHVFDFNNDGVFNPGDVVLFSLGFNSHSLANNLIPGANASTGGAFVFRKPHGMLIQVFASAANLGLGAHMDNIDSLEILPCADPYACALNHGIIGDEVVGGCPTVSTWGLITFTLLLAAAGTILIRRRQQSEQPVA